MAICPFIGDQPFWARRVRELDVGPVVLDKHKMDADALAGALRTLDEPIVRARAGELAQAVQSEDGVTSAINFIELKLTNVRAGKPGTDHTRTARRPDAIKQG